MKRTSKQRLEEKQKNNSTMKKTKTKMFICVVCDEHDRQIVQKVGSCSDVALLLVGLFGIQQMRLYSLWIIMTAEQTLIMFLLL